MSGISSLKPFHSEKDTARFLFKFTNIFQMKLKKFFWFYVYILLHLSNLSITAGCIEFWIVKVKKF